MQNQSNSLITVDTQLKTALKHVLKCYDIFSDVHNNRHHVVVLSAPPPPPSIHGVEGQ